MRMGMQGMPAPMAGQQMQNTPMSQQEMKELSELLAAKSRSLRLVGLALKLGDRDIISQVHVLDSR